ncbi:hypothetical protein AVEN_257764-1, partial [Araneus ventricosus]
MELFDVGSSMGIGQKELKIGTSGVLPGE